MNVRDYQSGDSTILARLFSETVRAINVADYSSEQIEAWAADALNVESWLGQQGGRVVLVAEKDSEIVGFSTFEPDGHIDHLYVHHLFQRCGVASALLRRIEEEAASRNIERIFTEASITARPFFEHAGFSIIAAQNVTVKGTSFLNYRMEKSVA